MKFTILLFFDKNEKTPETLDFTGFSGGVFGVPEVIRTPDLPLRSDDQYGHAAPLQCYLIPVFTGFSRVTNVILYPVYYR